ncbi:MAG: hypothetical protein RIR06_1520 [Bacteroidota bacterium]|jgi:tetratricopeptide (TPR) repeat protein
MIRIGIFILFSLLTTHVFTQIIVQAEQAYDSGRYDEALALAVQADSTQFSGCDWFVFGNILFKNGFLERADLAYQSASLSTCDGASELALNRGICNYQMGNYLTSQELLLLHSHQFPQDYKGHYWLAANYYSQGKNKQAVLALERSLECNDHYAPSYFLEGAIFYSKKQYSAALNSMEEALRADSNLVAAKLEYGIILLQLNQLNEAMQTFQDILLGVNDYRDQAFYFAGETAYFMHEKDKACEYWKQGENLGDYYSAENWKRLCVEGKKPRVRKNTKVAF